MSATVAKRVLVTRPEPGASETARRLDGLGFLPVKLPLQETKALPIDPLITNAAVTAVAVPSASAIRHAPPHLLEKYLSLPCFAVGEATGKAAREAGFSDVILADGDAGSLAEITISSKPEGQVLYLCGRVRRQVFEQKLADAGVQAAVIETYDALPIAHATDELRHVLGTEGIDFALVYSANAATQLTGLMARDAFRPRFDHTTLICISARVAGIFQGNGSKVVIAGEPSEAALLKALQDAVATAS